jgi:ferric-dicitrate binding protein FerR (iron transport regulator)
VADAELFEAFSAWADGSASLDTDIEAIDALAALLGRDAAARAELVQYALLEVALHHVFTGIPLPWWRRPLGPGGVAGVLLVVFGLVGGAIALRSGDGPQVVARPQNIGRVEAGEVQVGGKIATDVLGGADLVVPAGSPATLRLRDGSAIIVKPGSRLRITPLDDVGSGFEVGLPAGGAEFRLVNGHREFRVVTPFGGMRAQGPHFSVSVDEEKRALTLAGPLVSLGGPLPVTGAGP